MRLAGKAGVVTGTSRGLGREILSLAVGEGARAVAMARSEQEPVDGAVLVRGDVRREEDVVAAIERCRSELGALDFARNNAVLLGAGRPREATNQLWDDL